MERPNYRVNNFIDENLLDFGSNLHSKSIEAAVIGAILVDSTLYLEAKKLVTPQMFDFLSHEADVIFELCEVGDYLIESKIMALMSKKGYFVGTENKTAIPHLRFLSNTEGLLENCEIISENYHVKQRARLAMELLSSLKLKQLPSDVFSKHDEGLENLERRRNDMNSERISFADDLESTFISIEKAKLSGITITGLDTGIEELTKYTAGFQRGELSIIGGVPGRGKSTLGIQFFNHIASQLIPCLFVSIEMTPNQYNRKLFAARTGVSVSRQILCEFNDGELLKIKGAKDDLKKLPFFSETKKMSLSDIVRSIKFHVLSNGVEFVLVDHLHIIKIDSGLTGEAKYNFISNELKLLAKDLDIHIQLLGHQNRATIGKPTVSSLKYGGDGAADLMIFPFSTLSDEELQIARQGQYIECDLEIVKNRTTGTVGKVEAYFDTHHDTYISKREYEDSINLAQSRPFTPRADDRIIVNERVEYTVDLF